MSELRSVSAPIGSPHRKELIELLRVDLEAANFTVESLNELWGEEAAAALFRGQRLPAERVLAARRNTSPDPTGTLATVFVLGRSVPAGDLSDALRRLGCAGAAALGLVRLQAGRAEPLLDLRPYSFEDQTGCGAWWVASDLGELALGHAIPEFHVLGVGGASMTLSGLMIGSPVERALDLGTGCGIQAMHLARHARQVVATDISERALDIAQFNCELNGVSNVEFRAGNLFVPMSGEEFDQIVSNPPFVITPRRPGVPAYEYRDGGLVGDALVADVIRSVAHHLRPGGFAQLLGNWEYQDGIKGLTRVAEWLADAQVGNWGDGLDAWVVERELLDAPGYAETWIRDCGTQPGTAEFDTLYAAWLDDFAERSVQAVGFGYLTVRRPSEGSVALHRLEHVETSGANPGGLGEHIAASFRTHDRQHALTDDDLAAERLLVAADVTEERHYWPGAEDPTVISLRQGGGFGRLRAADTGLAAFVGACDGELTVDAICTALAQILSVDVLALRAELLAAARELLFDGFLCFANSSNP